MEPPWTSLPICTMTAPPTSVGEADVPQNNLLVSTRLEKSFDQSCFPVASSQAYTCPLVPTVTTRPEATSGVAFGPFAMRAAYLFLLNAAPYLFCQTIAPVFASSAVTSSSGS